MPMTHTTNAHSAYKILDIISFGGGKCDQARRWHQGWHNLKRLDGTHQNYIWNYLLGHKKITVKQLHLKGYHLGAGTLNPPQFPSCHSVWHCSASFPLRDKWLWQSEFQIAEQSPSGWLFQVDSHHTCNICQRKGGLSGYRLFHRSRDESGSNGVLSMRRCKTQGSQKRLEKANSTTVNLITNLMDSC